MVERAARERAGISDIFYSQWQRRNDQRAAADCGVREHEWTGRAGVGEQRWARDCEISGGAAEPVRALLAVFESGVARSGDGKFDSADGAGPDVRLARQFAAGS